MSFVVSLRCRCRIAATFNILYSTEIMKRILSSSAVMNNNASSSRLSILATLLLLSSRFYATSACGFYFSVGCEGSFPYTATNTLTLTLSGEAEVIYHWTEKNTYSGTVSLNGEETLDAVSFDYGKTGEYYVGATVIWGDGSGCEGTQGEDFSLISFTGNSCDVDDDAEPPQYLLENGMTYEPGVQDGGSNAPTSMESQVREIIYSRKYLSIVWFWMQHSFTPTFSLIDIHFWQNAISMSIS